MMPQPVTKITLGNQTPDAAETGQTGGWLLQAPAAFFRRFTRKKKPNIAIPKPANCGMTTDTIANLLKPQPWMVTWQNQNGDVQTSLVAISGYWKLSGIESQARQALFCQHEVENVQILRLSLDFNITLARLEALQTVQKQYHDRLRFEAECG